LSNRSNLIYLLLAFFLLLIPNELAAQTDHPAVDVSGQSDGRDRIAAIDKLQLASIPGDLPAYYSPHGASRAHSLQALLSGELAFYSKVFDCTFAPVTLAVLNAKQWPTVSGDEPYGMPSMSDSKPWVFVMPLDWHEVTALPMPQENSADSAIQQRVRERGVSWRTVQFQAGDGIGAHEVGHSIINQVGINAQVNWFNEFLASYIGYAYLKEQHPDQLLGNEIFWKSGLAAPHPFTSLRDFETRYAELSARYPQNYGWYEFTFEERVIEVYREQGIGFLTKVRRDFPRDGPKLSGDQVLDKLEAMHPGWKAWASHVEKGEVSPADGIVE